jgi:hypothetical protein
MNKDELSTLNSLTNPNPFGAPAAQMVRGPQARTEYDSKWDRDEPNQIQVRPVTPEENKVLEKVMEELVEEDKDYGEPAKPARNLKSLKPPKAKKEEKFLNPIHESRNQDGLPSYRCEFEGRDLMVGFPCYKTTNPVTAFTMLAMALDFSRDKIRFDMAIGDAMVYHARNAIAAKFLETDAKWLLMLDDDIIPSIGRPGWMRTWVSAARNLQDLPLQRHVLHRLVGSGKTLVGGAYFGRQEGGALMCSDLSLTARARAYADEVIPVDWVATGCMLVHRSVFEDIQKKFPELKGKTETGAFNFFQPKDDGSGEDVSFCRRAKDSGHQPYIDLGLPVFHVGYKVY